MSHILLSLMKQKFVGTSFLSTSTVKTSIQQEQKKDKDKDINTNINVSFNKETTPEATKNMPPVVISLPCLKGYNHPIYEDDIKHYQELYPAVNVHQELKLMLGWLESNPTNRKTKNGIKSFITRWLSKKQDKRTIIPSDSKKDKWDVYKFNEI